MSESDTDIQEDSDCIDHTDEQTLRQLYHGENLSMSAIAERADRGRSTIGYWMNKHNIERRSISQAKTLQHGEGFVSLNMDSNGYYRWEVQYNGEKDTVPVHRLLAVAEYGFGKVEDSEVHHINEIPWLNYAENIMVMSAEEHMTVHKSGENSPFAKLSKSDVEEIRSKLSSGYQTQSLACEYGVSKRTIRDIRNGDTWSE